MADNSGKPPPGNRESRNAQFPVVKPVIDSLHCRTLKDAGGVALNASPCLRTLMRPFSGSHVNRKGPPDMYKMSLRLGIFKETGLACSRMASDLAPPRTLRQR